MRKFALIAVSLFAVAMFAAAQMNMSDDKSKRPSPPASAACKFSDGKTIKIDYSSPRAKGRKIFGEASEKALVPYGQIWRTGANDATTFVTDTNVTVGGKAVPAGSYTIFTAPKADAWSLVISKKTGEWGTDYPGEKEDLVRVPMTVSKTSAPVENFTIAFDQAGSKCALRIEWENTRASVEITK
ncbi:MAG: hypothetical protein QOF56_1744 [Acidobacteriaceae bacterium]|nr:hypothetical protein [Acidobacteriaceae bacterium]